jgi:hypothetical protein
MSVLPAEIHSALAQVLQALQSADNNVRTQAEGRLHSDWTAERPDVLLMGLVEQMQGSQEPAVRCLGVSRPTQTDLIDRHDLLLRCCFVELPPKPAKLLMTAT